MRLRTPSTVPTWDIVVRKPTSEHVSVRSASGDDASGISSRFAALASAALIDALHTVAETSPEGWAVIQIGNKLGGWLALERMERLDLRCADLAGGRATAEALRTAFQRLGVLVKEPVPGTGEDLSHPSIALHCGVVFGREEVAEVEAELVPDRDRKVPRLEGPNWPPVRCPGCEVEARPTSLAWGYPAPWVEALIKLLADETEDRMTLMGCIIPEKGLAFWACPACEAPYHPGWLEAEDVAAAVLEEGKPVARCPRFFTSKEAVLWSPEAETEGKGQRYAIAPGMAARLDEAPVAWVGFRPKNGATLFVDWTDIREAAPGPIERPLAFSTRLGKQVVRVRGYILAAKLVV